MNNTSVYGAMAGVMYFYFITTIYFIVRHIVTNDKVKIAIMILYFLAVVVGEFIINLTITSQICGNADFGQAAIVTIIPWVIIFGLLKVILTAFPGWLSPFSNTFGYLVTNLMGINKLLNEILVPKFIKENTPDNLKAAAESLEHIYGNKSLLINEITQDNYETFWDRMKSAGLFKQNAEQHKEGLLNFVKMKDNVAEFVWYCLTGGLVASVSYNSIINSTCKANKATLEKNVQATKEAEQQKEKQLAQEKQNSTFYKVTE